MPLFHLFELFSVQLITQKHFHGFSELDVVRKELVVVAVHVPVVLFHSFLKNALLLDDSLLPALQVISTEL